MLFHILSLSLLGFVPGALGRGDHQESLKVPGETIQQYAQRHVCLSVGSPCTTHSTDYARSDVIGASHVITTQHSPPFPGRLIAIPVTALTHAASSTYTI